VVKTKRLKIRQNKQVTKKKTHKFCGACEPGVRKVGGGNETEEGGGK